MLAHIPGLRTIDNEEVEECVGKGWAEAEEFWTTEIAKLVGPEFTFA
jgi:hypothetical protein